MSGAVRRGGRRGSETPLHDDEGRRKTELGDENIVLAWCVQRGRANALRIPLAAERLGGTRCPQRVGKANAVLPPNFVVFYGQQVSSSAFGDWIDIVFGEADPPCTIASGAFADSCSSQLASVSSSRPLGVCTSVIGAILKT